MITAIRAARKKARDNRATNPLLFFIGRKVGRFGPFAASKFKTYKSKMDKKQHESGRNRSEFDIKISLNRELILYC